MFKVFFEDTKVGDVFTFGDKLVSREEIIDFASKYDPQAFHLDDEAAKEHSPFGALCASGWHTSAMTMRMMVDDMQSRGVAGAGSPGIDNLRWRRPVFPGDRLRVRTTITNQADMPKRPEMAMNSSLVEVLNQDDVVVMHMNTNYMIFRRPKGDK